MIAQFITVWDCGTIISTNCSYDATNRLVSDVQQVDADHVTTLDETYLELGDGEKVRDFYNDDEAVRYVDGQPEE